MDIWQFSTDLTNLMSRKDRIFRVLRRWSFTLSVTIALIIVKSFNLFNADRSPWWLIIVVAVSISIGFILDVVNAVRPLFETEKFD
jgi:hypothetical protein